MIGREKTISLSPKNVVTVVLSEFAVETKQLQNSTTITQGHRKIAFYSKITL